MIIVIINLPDMSQLPISSLPMHGTSGTGNVLTIPADMQTGERYINAVTGILRKSQKCSNCEQ